MSINTKDLIAEVRKVAESNPNYVYYGEKAQNMGAFGCSYLADAFGDRDGQPCLIGQALRNLKITVPKSHEHTDIASLLKECEIDVVISDSEDVKWLQRAQGRQDSGYSWGQAIHYANNL